MKSHRKVLRWHPNALLMGRKGGYSIMVFQKDGSAIKLGAGTTPELAWDNAAEYVTSIQNTIITLILLGLAAMGIIGYIIYIYEKLH